MNADFGRLISTRFLFKLAVTMQAVIVGWRMFELTHAALYLGLIGLAEAAPALTIAVYAGYLVDRSRPTRIYLGVLIGSLVSAAMVLATQTGAWSNADQVTALFVASFVTGVARGFSQPAMYAVVPRLVPTARLSRATAWLSTAMQTAGVLGPVVGGLAYGWAGPRAASLAPTVCLGLAIAIWLTLRTRIAPPARATGTRVRDELLSGARFVFAHPILLPALSLDMLSVLFGGVEALLPVYAAEVLLTDARGLGLLRAAPAVGAVFTGLLLTRVDIRARAGRYLLGSVFGFGVCIVVFAVSRDFWLSVGTLAFSGAFDGVSTVVRSTAVQLVSPDHLRGRISAINSIFIGSSNELGEFESGVAAHVFGLVPAVLMGGLACLGVVGWISLRSPRLARLNLIDLERALPGGDRQ